MPRAPRSSTKEPSSRAPEPPPPRVAVVVSLYNKSVTAALQRGALRAYSARYPNAPEHSVDVLPVSGAFEIVPVVAQAARSGRYDAVVALGCIIKGETSHDLHLATAVTTSLAHIAATGGPDGAPIAVGLGVLTVDTPQQARERAGGGGGREARNGGGSPKLGNKGEEAMLAALQTCLTLRAIHNGRPARVESLPSTRPLPDKAR
ncbi:MAG: 6,7-dimethyl-8-ribityllumazine synthase [Phycisphaeraceae bacterium]|nr:6,7-dimethyl-8-ribityllumazine synthase [Phycisphaeraceae bacterium]